MDEIDSIGSSRMEGGQGGDSEVQRTMLELLNQLDGFEPAQNIKVRPRACWCGPSFLFLRSCLCCLCAGNSSYLIRDGGGIR